MRELLGLRLRVRAWLRAGLVGLALALLAAGWLAFAPGGPVGATSGTKAGQIVGRTADRAICTGTNDTEGYAGPYVRSGTSITIRMKAWVTWPQVGCTFANVLTYSDNADYDHSRVRGSWLLQLRTATGGGGSLISGANIQLPASFSGARSGVHNSRSGTAAGGGDDGDWPHRKDSSSLYAQHDVYIPQEISFTVPSSHSGDVYLRIRIDVRSASVKPYTTTEDFSFRFSPPLIDAYHCRRRRIRAGRRRPPTSPAAPRGRPAGHGSGRGCSCATSRPPPTSPPTPTSTAAPSPAPRSS